MWLCEECKYTDIEVIYTDDEVWPNGDDKEPICPKCGGNKMIELEDE